MHIPKLLRTALTAAALFAAASLAQATTTVDQIVKRGSVKIGVLSGVPVYGSVDDKGNPAGYDIDVARVLGGYLGVKVDLVPLTPPARIPALQAGKIDFLVATLAATPERAKVVMFSKPYSAFRMVVFAGRGAPLRGLADLQGKRIGVNRGSSQETALVRAALPGLEIVRYQDDATVVQALIAHQIDAVAVPDSVAREVARQQPGADLLIKFTFFIQPNAMAVRLEETEMRDWLNKAIEKMTASGELQKIAQKWTGSDLPDLARLPSP